MNKNELDKLSKKELMFLVQHEHAHYKEVNRRLNEARAKITALEKVRVKPNSALTPDEIKEILEGPLS